MCLVGRQGLISLPHRHQKTFFGSFQNGVFAYRVQFLDVDYPCPQNKNLNPR